MPSRHRYEYISFRYRKTMSSIQITKEKYSDLSRQGFYKNLNEIENTYSMKIAYFAYNLDSCDHEESMVKY